MKKLVLTTLLVLAACGGESSEAAKKAKPPFTFAEKYAAAHHWTPLDYADPQHWECSAERTDDVCDKTFTMSRMATDGTVGITPYQAAEDPKVDCFFIYPTLDFNVFQGANHEGMDAVSLSLPRRTIEAQVGPFSSVCRVFAPYYRQGTFGAYLTTLEQSVWVFENAFGDVTAAFEYYLRHWNHGRPVVIIGHSQGAQHSSYLLHSYFDGERTVTDIPGSETTKQLRDRLVLALPIGFSHYVPRGELKGGTFSDIPLCTDETTPGCVIHYRSYTEGFEFDGYWNNDLNVRMAREGLLFAEYDPDKHVISCVNPALRPMDEGRALDWNGVDVAGADTRILDGTYVVGVMMLLNAGDLTQPREQHFPGRYTATCREEQPGGDQYLAIGYHEPVTGSDPRPDPFDIDGVLAHAGLGLHIYDFNLPMGELIEHVRRRAEKF